LKDRRYRAIKSLIQSNGIQKFQDIFSIIPISIVKEDMKVNYNTLRRRIDNPQLLTVKDILALSELFEIDSLELMKVIFLDLKEQKQKKSK